MTSSNASEAAIGVFEKVASLGVEDTGDDEPAMKSDGAVIGENGVARYGEAPNRPMIEGSRWCNWGMALNRCVIKRAPFLTASVAISEVATL